MEFLIKERRKEAGISQEELSRKSGVARTIISGLESGTIKTTTTKTLAKIAKVLGLEVGDILNESEEKMDEHIWLVSWLDKDANGNVEGYTTAVRAAEITAAASKALDFIVAVTARSSAIFITNIGLGEEVAADLIGRFDIDNMAIDWPESL